jgi:hypothetical protein
LTGPTEEKEVRSTAGREKKGEQRTFTSTTFSLNDVILATIHSLVFSCSAITPVALRK